MKPLTITRIQEIQDRRRQEESEKSQTVVEVPLYRNVKITHIHQSKMALYR